MIPAHQAYLKIPGAWLKACGKGDLDRVFKVVSIDARSDWWTFAVVDCDGWNWVVHVPGRRATFMSAGEALEFDGMGLTDEDEAILYAQRGSEASHAAQVRYDQPHSRDLDVIAMCGVEDPRGKRYQNLVRAGFGLPEEGFRDLCIEVLG